MLRVCCRNTLRNPTKHLVIQCARASSSTSPSGSTSTSHHHPNAPLDLDPAFQALLRDVDLANKNNAKATIIHTPREAVILPFDEKYEPPPNVEDEWLAEEEALRQRKSPEAAFGSRQIGATVLPIELREAIEGLIADSDKHALHEDARRLFYAEKSSQDPLQGSWETSYSDKKLYKSRKQASRHHERDGTAFASVALPAHYSVIHAVLDHVKWRLGEGWKVDRVMDWGSGVGSGYWAAAHVFQRPSEGLEDEGYTLEDMKLSDSSLSTYLGLERREGLAAQGKRLMKDMNSGSTTISWQKGFTDFDKVDPSSPEGRSSLALSAFLLSSLPNNIAKKQLVKEMWDSGADVIVLIDHDSRAGFESIAEAREYLLRLGRRESESEPLTSQPSVLPSSEGTGGCHIIAPCPHENHCPLYLPNSSRPICSFSQRLQRPTFLRRTKDVRGGHEDNGYSYVVVRRGMRLGLRATMRSGSDEVGEGRDGEVEGYGERVAVDTDADGKEGSLKTIIGESNPEVVAYTEDSAEDKLRVQAYDWPRLVFPPLKKSGHIILDSCTPSGQILRMTIPKSQGKQPFYDARKSSWGDIFPHPPKNSPQVRFDPPTEHQRMKAAAGVSSSKSKSKSKSKFSLSEVKNDSKGKRGENLKPRISYERIANEVGEAKKVRKSSLRRHRDAAGDYDDDGDDGVLLMPAFETKFARDGIQPKDDKDENGHLGKADQGKNDILEESKDFEKDG